MASTFVKYQPLSTFNSASVTGSYQAINASGLTAPCFKIRIANNSNQAITVSYDGVNDHEYIIGGQTLELNTQENAQPSAGVALIKKGTIVYLKGTAGTGTIAFSGYYC